MLGKSNVHGALLDLLKHFVRTCTTETRQTRQRNDTKIQFSDGLALATRQRSRRHTLDLPHHAQVAPQVTRLLATSSFAHTMFSFIDAMLSSNSCAYGIESLLDGFFESQVTEDTAAKLWSPAADARDRIQCHGAEAHRRCLGSERGMEAQVF